MITPQIGMIDDHKVREWKVGKVKNIVLWLTDHYTGYFGIPRDWLLAVPEVDSIENRIIRETGIREFTYEKHSIEDEKFGIDGDHCWFGFDTAHIGDKNKRMRFVFSAHKSYSQSVNYQRVVDEQWMFDEMEKGAKVILRYFGKLEGFF